MCQLIELFNKYQTLKVGHNQEHYATTYEFYLEPIKDQIKRVLEIGVGNGGCLKAWREYFPNIEQVVGIDIDHNCLTARDDKIEVMIGDQTDPQFLTQKVLSGGPYDLIVDDGAHTCQGQLVSLLFLFPYLAPGGYYVIEDIGTSYIWTFGMHMGTPDTTVGFLKALIDDVNYEISREFAPISPKLRSLDSISFHKGLCFIRKK